ncbi:MAG: radical SAM protein, partial [Candidatus Thorarchaeota archaeon]
MTRLDGVPFITIRPKEHNGGWILESPVRNTRHTISHIDLTALSLCDGFRTLSEIIEELRRSGHPKAERLISDSDSLLRVLSDDGIIWWRQQRMTRRLMRPPSSVVWELTDRCNLSCHHCATDASHRGFNEMPLDECINLIRELASFGVQRLVLSGGEPLIRSDFFEIAHECTERNFKTQVATNATLVTKEGAQALADLSIDAQVSIDGATPNVHDHIRRGLGSFSKAIKGVQSLVRAGVHVTIATVVIKPNFHEIISILDLAEKLEAYEFRLLPFLPIGRGALSEDLHVHPLDIRMLITKLRRLRKKSRIQIAPMEFECTLEKPSQEEPDQQAPIGCDGA